MDKKLKRGLKIDESEIPPVVATGGKPMPPSAPEPAPPPPESEVIQLPISSNATEDAGHSAKRVGGEFPQNKSYERIRLFKPLCWYNKFITTQCIKKIFKFT